MRTLKVSGPTAISAAVPLKVIKKATGRVRLRRKMYQAVAEMFPSIVSGLHVVVFANKVAETADDLDFNVAIKEIFVKAGLLR